MPLHDWSRVDAGTFHDFHNSWVVHLKESLNGGILPKGYYAQSEQHAGRFIADVLTLHAEAKERGPAPTPVGGLALAEAPPQAERKLTVSTAARSRRRTLTIRHVSGHRIIALVEIVSPANKDRQQHVDDFVVKVTTALAQGIHVTVGDFFAPTRHDPVGMNGAIWQTLDESEDAFTLAPATPFTLAAYVADVPVDVYLKYPVLGELLPDMPLFLTPAHYVNLPLERTYLAAFQGMPEVWRDVLRQAP